jgi:hypothetical protein
VSYFRELFYLHINISFINKIYYILKKHLIQTFVKDEKRIIDGSHDYVERKKLRT